LFLDFAFEIFERSGPPVAAMIAKIEVEDQQGDSYESEESH